jgi:hypothetical protein
MFVFASAHVRMTAHGSKNKDDSVHHVHARFTPSFVVGLTSANPINSERSAVYRS